MDTSSNKSKDYNKKKPLQKEKSIGSDDNQTDSLNLFMSMNEKKATHSEIEKRRRQKMNKHLNELVYHLPVSSSKNKKPDKITILKMAVQHMKNLKSSTSILSDSFLCQNYITPLELQSLVLKESDEFLIVIKCDSSKIIYVSETCSNCIGFQSSEMVDRVFFEIIHPSDTKQVKDELIYQDSNNLMGPASNFMLNKSKSYTTGDRRSFVCRVKCGPSSSRETHNNYPNSNLISMVQDKNSLIVDPLKSDDYKIVHFVGYLRSDISTNLKFKESTLIEQQQHHNKPHQNTENLCKNSSNSVDSELIDNYNNQPSTSGTSNTQPSSIDSNQVTRQSSSSNSNSNPNSTNVSMISSKTNEIKNSFAKYHSAALYEPSTPGMNDSLGGLNSSSSSSLNGNPVLQYYLIAWAKIRSKPDEELAQYKYMSRHDADGKFIFLEPSVHTVVGYLPNQLMSESLFNYVHADDKPLLKKAFQESIVNSKHKIRTHQYKFKLKNDSYVVLESILYALKNPFNGQFEYIVAQNKLCSIPLQASTIPNPTQQQVQIQQAPQTSNYNTTLVHPQHQNINLSNVSLPMTPSPEETIITNENIMSAEKLLSINKMEYNESLNKLNNNPNNAANDFVNSYNPNQNCSMQSVSNNNNNNNPNKNFYYYNNNNNNNHSAQSNQNQASYQMQQMRSGNDQHLNTSSSSSANPTASSAPASSSSASAQSYQNQQEPKFYIQQQQHKQINKFQINYESNYNSFQLPVQITTQQQQMYMISDNYVSDNTSGSVAQSSELNQNLITVSYSDNNNNNSLDKSRNPFIGGKLLTPTSSQDFKNAVEFANNSGNDESNDWMMQILNNDSNNNNVGNKNGNDNPNEIYMKNS